MNTKDIILSQLSACHNQNSWFVSLNNAIHGLTAEQAFWKSNETVNSIWEIVSHLAFYNKRYLNRFKDIPISNEVDSNENTFKNIDGLSWEHTVELTNKILSEWIIFVEECGDEEIQRWSSDITYLTLHNAYHIGQIVHIRKQREIWDPKQGVH